MIRLAQYEELPKIAELMLDVFNTKMRSLYSEDGQVSFSQLISLSSLEKRFLSHNSFYIFIENEDIKAVLELEDPCHIAFLFVGDEGKGLGKSLCLKAIENTSEEVCTVGAWSAAVSFYKKLGFIEIAEEKVVNEMPFILMAKTAKA